MNDHLCLTLISSRPSTKRERADDTIRERVLRDGFQTGFPQDRSEHDQRELARIKRFLNGRSDAPAPVPFYERCD